MHSAVPARSSAPSAGVTSPVPTGELGATLNTIDTLFKEFKEIKDSNDPVENQKAREARFDKLHAAYALCLSQIQTGNPTIMARTSMILGEFGIMLYGKEPKYPGKTFPVEADFSISKQILLGALQAFLVRIGANQVTCQFNAGEIADLKHLPEVILTLMPFASVEEGFIKADKNVLIEMARKAGLTDLEYLHFCRILRFLNGASRSLRGEYQIHALNQREKSDELQKGAMNAEDKKLTINALYLARDFARCDDNEFWEVMYNDWSNALQAEGTWDDDAKLRLAGWLIENAKNDSQIARVCNKFIGDVNGTRQSLGKCLEILKRKMTPQDYETLTQVIQGKMLDPREIEHLTKKLFALDLTGQDHLTISWFAIVPNNLASRLMQAQSTEFKEIQGLLALAGAIVDAEKASGNHHVNFQAINNNRARFLLYLNDPIRLAMARATEAGAVFQNAVKDLARPTQDTLNLLRQAREAALAAQEAFKGYLTREGERTPALLDADRIAQESLALTGTILAKIEQVTDKLQQPQK